MSCDILVALHKLQQNPEQTIPIHPIGPPSFSIENNNIILMGNVMAGPGALPPSKWSSSISQPYLNIKYALIFGACPGHCHISPHIHNITIQSQQQQKKKTISVFAERRVNSNHRSLTTASSNYVCLCYYRVHKLHVLILLSVVCVAGAPRMLFALQWWRAINS